MSASFAPRPREADLDPPRRDLRVLLFSHKVDLGRPDISMSGELPHLVHGRPVPDGIVDRRLPERMDADPSPSQPCGVDAGRLAVFLDQPPGGLAVQVPPHQPGPVRAHGPKQRPLLVLTDPCSGHVGQDRPGRVQQDLSPLPVPLLGDVEEVLDAVGLQVTHAGAGHGRHADIP